MPDPITSASAASGAPKTVAVIGGGLVGALSALYFAKRGWSVTVFEQRPDMCLSENKAKTRGRSINLAISERGLAALRNLDPDLEQQVLDRIIPMYGRMIHSPSGMQESQAYSVFGQHINSVSRTELNCFLLDKARELPNVSLRFNHSFISADFDARLVRLIDRSQGDEGKPVHVTADLVIGADGAHSKVRSQLQRKVMMNFQQEYIEHRYCELSMDPNSNGDYVMPPNYLHIWPRKTFMLIALPNLDRSFTCTLFMPWSVFQSIKTDHDLVGLFRAYFPDALALIGEEKLKREYFANPKCSLGYVKCKPYHYKDRVVILGDAAHCMVPFYGQGMNCGFEDVAVLDRILRSIAGYQSQFTSHLSDDQIESALAHYSATRPKNAAAIVDLALHNYIEMRSNVISLSYKFWNYVERILQRFMPHYVIPLYSMVSFSHRPYSEVIDRWKRQTAILHNTIKLFALAIVVGALSLSLTYFGPRVGLRLPHLGELARLFYYHQ